MPVTRNMARTARVIVDSISDGSDVESARALTPSVISELSEFHPVPSPWPRIFNIIELVDLICNYLESPSLLALAMTAHHFQSSALKRLYCTLDSQGVGSLISKFTYTSALSSMRMMTAERFAMCAEFVRNLDLNLRTAREATWITQLPSVIVKSVTLPIFPSLRSISARVGNDRQLVGIQFLLTGNLLHLEALALKCRYQPSTQHDVHELTILLDILPVRCPNLRRVNIRVTGTECPDMSTAFAESLSKLTYLGQVSLKNISVGAQVTQSLSQHRSLKTLSLEHHRQLESVVSANALPVIVSTRLRKVHLGLPSTELAEHLIAMPDSLDELTLTGSVGDSESISTLLAALPRFRRLTRLELTLSNTPQRRLSIVTMSSVLNSIIGCRTLRSLRIYGPESIRPPRDGDFQCAGTAWPELRSLELRWNNRDYGPTLRSLLALSQGCPHLAVLELGHVLGQDKAFILPEGVLRSHTLKLTIGHISSEHPDALAVLLAGRWASVKLRAGTKAHDVLQGIKAIRRYQAGQAAGGSAFDPDADSLL